jgi:hypothetical protein
MLCGWWQDGWSTSNGELGHLVHAAAIACFSQEWA